MRLIGLILCLLLQACSSSKYYYPEEPPPPLPSFYLPERIRVALVLGSGGVRGMAHVGVIEELVEAGIPIDLIVGCSAGSIVGSIYADNPSVEHIKCAIWGLKTDSMLDINLLTCRYGLSQSGSMHRTLDEHLEAEEFHELKIPFVAVATDLHSGELVVMGGGDLVKSVQASCSIPFFIVPCDYGGRILVDGGVVNPVPVQVAKDLGAEMIIAVDLCELLSRTEPSNLFQIANRSAEIGFMWQNQGCTQSADFVIRPKTSGIGAFNDRMKQQLYDAGKQATHRVIHLIQEKFATLKNEPLDECKWRLITPKCYTPDISMRENAG